MTLKVIFFMFPVLLVLLPVIIYNRYSPFMAKTWLRIITVPNARRVPANILFILLCFFLTIYYAVFPKDWGITPSIFIVVFLAFTSKSIKLLYSIRRNRHLRWSITLACLIMPFIPHLLSLVQAYARKHRQLFGLRRESGQCGAFKGAFHSEAPLLYRCKAETVRSSARGARRPYGVLTFGGGKTSVPRR